MLPLSIVYAVPDTDDLAIGLSRLYARVILSMLSVFTGLRSASKRGLLSFKSCTRQMSSAVLDIPPNLSTLETPADNEKAKSWIEYFQSQKIPRALVELTFSRSSGPGGQVVSRTTTPLQIVNVELQNVNKVNTKATLRCSIHAKWIPPWAKDALKRTVRQITPHPLGRCANRRP